MIKSLTAHTPQLLAAPLLVALVLAQATVGLAQPPAHLQPDPSAWEHKVSPPPRDEWIKHMPSDPARIKSLPGHAVRIAYVIPSNRTAQANATAKLQYAIIRWRAFYLDQMERNGFGAKTFSI